MTSLARAKLARRSATTPRRSPPLVSASTDLVAVEVEDVVGVVDDALGGERGRRPPWTKRRNTPTPSWSM